MSYTIKDLKRVLKLTLIFISLLLIGCEDTNVYCWQCIQTTTTEIDVGYTYGDLHKRYCGTIEQKQYFECMYTYDAYHTNWLTGEPVLVHLTTKCSLE